MIGLNILTFFLAAIVVALNMGIAKGIAGFWLNGEKATVAGFAFTLGTLAGVRQAELDDGGYGLLAGAIAALVSLWWVHFGKKPKEVSNG